MEANVHREKHTDRYERHIEESGREYAKHQAIQSCNALRPSMLVDTWVFKVIRF